MNATHSDNLLNSWKEIAVYLNRGVRTVQRWEVELGMPVRRPRGRERSAVIAMRSDLDAWLRACPVTERTAIKRDGKFPQEIASLQPVISQSSELRGNVRRNREEMRASLNKLLSTLAHMTH